MSIPEGRNRLIKTVDDFINECYRTESGLTVWNALHEIGKCTGVCVSGWLRQNFRRSGTKNIYGRQMQNCLICYRLSGLKMHTEKAG